MRTQGEDGSLQAKERGPEETNPADTWILNFWPPQPCNNKFLLFKPLSLWCFVMVPLANKCILDKGEERVNVCLGGLPAIALLGCICSGVKQFPQGLMHCQQGCPRAEGDRGTAVFKVRPWEAADRRSRLQPVQDWGAGGQR